MPRLRVARKTEDLKDIPHDEDIQVELGETVEVQEPIPVRGRPDKEPEPIAEPDEPEVVVVAEEPEPQPKRITKNALQEQLDALKKQQEEAEKALQAAREREAAALRRAQEAELARHRDRQEGVTAQYDSVVNAISAKQNEYESLKQQRKAAVSSQDWDAESELNDKLIQARSDLAELERGKLALERQQEVEKNTPAPAGDPLAGIDTNPNLLLSEKDWIKKHPDAMTDPMKANLLNIAYQAAIQQFPRGSEGYFKFLDSQLGYKSDKVAAAPEPEREEEDEPEIVYAAPRETRRIPVAAPPSRETVSASGNRGQTNRVTLTAEEREAARISGISEIDYAKGKLELMKRKGADPERYGR